MDTSFLPTLFPPTVIEVTGQSLTVGVRARDGLEILVRGPLRVGRVTYVVEHARLLDVRRGPGRLTRNGTWLTVCGGSVPATSTLERHGRRVAEEIDVGVEALSSSEGWAAAVRGLVAYERSADAFRTMGSAVDRALSSPLLERAEHLASEPLWDAWEEVRIAGIAAQFPGRALGFALGLAGDDCSRLTADLEAAVTAVFPELLVECEHDHTLGFEARYAALLGCLPCAEDLGGCPVQLESFRDVEWRVDLWRAGQVGRRPLVR